MPIMRCLRFARVTAHRGVTAPSSMMMIARPRMHRHRAAPLRATLRDRCRRARRQAATPCAHGRHRTAAG